MPRYREEDSFSIRIDLSAEFDEAYEGDDDGYAWRDRWQSEVRPRVVRAVFEALRSDPRFETVPASRGASPERMLEIAVTFKTPRATRD